MGEKDSEAETTWPWKAFTIITMADSPRVLSLQHALFNHNACINSLNPHSNPSVGTLIMFYGGGN